jgi:hypothetical protein
MMGRKTGTKTDPRVQREPFRWFSGRGQGVAEAGDMSDELFHSRTSRDNQEG